MKKQSSQNAYWIQKTHLLRSDEYICSVCGHTANNAYKQCPSCGSNMGRNKYDPSWVDEAEMMDIFFED
ncbi:MAG: hypothetical protein MJ059_02580 [Lachnospiraceae bacterium]|nr:hypothetical protein [Lachnospiraceae bacterium]